MCLARVKGLWGFTLLCPSHPGKSRGRKYADKTEGVAVRLRGALLAATQDGL